MGNYPRLIIPSRGAYLFYIGALSAMYKTIGAKETHFIRTAFNLWLLPLTADWGGHAIVTSLSVRRLKHSDSTDYGIVLSF